MNKWIDVYPTFTSFKTKLNAFQPDLISDSDGIFYTFLSAYFEKYSFLSDNEGVNNASVFKVMSQFKLIFIKVLQEQKKEIKELIVSSSDSITQSADESIEEEDAEKFVQGGGSNKMLPSVISIIRSFINLPNIYNILETRMKVVFSPVDSDNRKSPTFFRLGDEAIILDALAKGADKMIQNKLNTNEFLTLLEKKVQENITAHPDKFKGPKGDDGLMSAAQVNSLITTQMNIQANHPITAADKTQLFNDITTINTNLSKKADTLTLFFQDGLNRQMFLDSMKQFFFQRGVLKDSELEFFYQENKQSAKTAFFQIKIKPKKEIFFDQQVNFNIIPKVGQQSLLTSSSGNINLDHLYHLIGWHSLYDEHFDQSEITNMTVKQNQGFGCMFNTKNKTVSILNLNDWLNEEGDYVIEYFFEIEKSSRDINLNTLSLYVNSTFLTNWKYAWFYVGMSTWGNWASASNNSVGVGWFKFDEQTTFKLNLKITLSKNSDNTRNYLFILTAQNQKSDNYVRFRAKKYLANQSAANFVKDIILYLNGKLPINQFSIPKHMNVKILEQVHH